MNTGQTALKMKYIVGFILGLLMGLPQGLSERKNIFSVDSLPRSTIWGIIAFGLVGGILMGFSLLRKHSRPFGKLSESISKYVDFYTLLMFGVLSIGVPKMINIGLNNIYASELLEVWFFTCAGIGMLLSGLIKLLGPHKAR